MKITRKFVHDWLAPAAGLLAIAGIAACAFMDALAVAAGCGL